MNDRSDSNLPGTRSRAWVLAAGAAAVTLGVIYYVASTDAQQGTAPDGSDEPIEEIQGTAQGTTLDEAAEPVETRGTTGGPAQGEPEGANRGTTGGATQGTTQP